MSPVGSASNVLLLGPNLDQHASHLCHEFGSSRPGHRQHYVYLVFTRSHAKQVREFVAGGPEFRNVVVVDAVPDGGAADVIDHESVTIETVAPPSNLTEIGVALSRHLPDMEGERIVVCVRSLTALLQYVDERRAYQFLNVMTNQLASVGAHAHFHLAPAAHDEQLLATLATLFEVVIEIGEDEPPSTVDDDDVIEAVERSQ